MLCQTPAFPGAEGAGAYATGGRGGNVYVVTSLAADGPGTLADAVSAPNRIVVFAVSGVIDLGKSGKKGHIKIEQPNITIAGQTAPGEGICIRNGSVEVKAGNVIIRYLRIRRGLIAKGSNGDGMDIKGEFENVIVDHISTSWATDENLTLTNANKVTAQYSIAAEGLDYYNPEQTPARHSEGSLFGSHAPDGRMTIHHMLYAHNRLRNPRTTGFDGDGLPPLLDFRNSVIYDCKELTSHTGSQAVRINVVNNYYKDGPSTGIEGHEIKQVVFTVMNDGPNRIYAAGNYVHGSPQKSANNWLAFNYRDARSRPEAEVRVDKPFDTPHVTTESAQEAYESVLSGAGCTLPSRDAVDLRIVNDVRHGTGAVINYETDIPAGGSWQTYHSLPAPADVDADGLPDYWQQQFGLDRKSATAISAGGYMNIEHYFNNTDPRGGSIPIVYAGATVSRAYRQDGSSGELQFTRTGSTDNPLTVSYTGTLSGSVVIPAGAKSARVAIQAGPQDQLTTLSIEARPDYHIGCPRSALVATVNGPAPKPVDIRKVDFNGGGSEADRQRFDEAMVDHKAWKKIKKAK